MEVAAGVTTRTLLASCQPIRQAVVLFADVMLLLVDSMVSSRLEVLDGVLGYVLS